MELEEAKNLIIKHYSQYIDKKVFFAATNQTLVIKAIDVTKDNNGEYDATCYTENAFEEDADFENGIFEHRSLKDVIENGRLL